MSQPIWRPSHDRIAGANLTAFMRRNQQGDYSSLYRWSIEKREEFWPAVWDFCEIVASQRWETVLENDRMPGANWFHGARLNFAENLLRHRDHHEALIFVNERGDRRSLTYIELYRQTAALAATLRSWGIQPGDRIAGYLPNIPETVVAMLAATSLGAVWSSCSPDFGLQAAVDRFSQIEPRVLFAADGYEYGGKSINCVERVDGLVKAIPSVEKVAIVPYGGGEPPLRYLNFKDCLSQAAGLDFIQLPFEHPVYILYSSGTTGKPKCIIHGAGGTLIQHLKELVLHTDLKREDRIVYFTTCGWMMWNWLVSSLAVGATVVLYDGSPFHPGSAALFDVAARERITIFGTSARYLSAVEKAGVEPRKTHDLSALQTILSTGSPLLPASFNYVYSSVKHDVCLSSISGGTDLISCFALGNPIAPVWRGELQTRGLGMKVEIFDDQGNSVRGKKGELVCTAAFPSMPTGFWNDPDGENYRSAYFEHYPGVWRHGDWAELTEHDGLIIYGRSDAVLNPGGVRIGTAEIYRVVEQFPEVLEALAVGQDWQGDVRVILFVRLREGETLTEELSQRIRQRIREQASPRHVPSKIVQIADIPRTVNGKITELAVRNAIHGRPAGNTDALANPEALELFRNLPELQS